MDVPKEELMTFVLDDGSHVTARLALLEESSDLGMLMSGRRKGESTIRLESISAEDLRHMLIYATTEPLPDLTHAQALSLLRQMRRFEFTEEIGNYEICDALKDPSPSFLALLTLEDFPMIFAAHCVPGCNTRPYGEAYARLFMATRDAPWEEATAVACELFYAYEGEFALDVMFFWCCTHAQDPNVDKLLAEVNKLLEWKNSEISEHDLLSRDVGACRSLEEFVLNHARRLVLARGLKRANDGMLRAVEFVPGDRCVRCDMPAASVRAGCGICDAHRYCCNVVMEPCACGSGRLTTECVEVAGRMRKLCLTCATKLRASLTAPPEKRQRTES
jgi:hypothetical protein